MQHCRLPGVLAGLATLIFSTVALAQTAPPAAGAKNPVGHVHSDALHITERIRRLDHEALEIRFTFDDPKAYTRPWEGSKRFELTPDISIMEDVVCEDKLR